MSNIHQDNYKHQARREHQRKHFATWGAAIGTLVLIVAFWALLLPTQLGGVKSFGIRNAASWLSAKNAPSGADEPTFQEALDRSRAMLDKIENGQRVQAQQETAVINEASQLREKIEAASAVPAEKPTETKPQ